MNFKDFSSFGVVHSPDEAVNFNVTARQTNIELN